MSKPTPVFYVFHGPDDFRQAEMLAELMARVGPPSTADLNTTNLDGPTVTVSELRQACDAIPFLADRRLVVVWGLLYRLAPKKGSKPLPSDQRLLVDLVTYLPSLPPTTRLVFMESRDLPSHHPILRLAEESDRGYARRLPTLTGAHLNNWIVKRAEKYGAAIDADAAQHLAKLLGDNLRLLDQELRKLAAFVDGDEPVTTDVIQTLVPYTKATVVWEMIDALAARDASKAADKLHSLLDAGEHPMALFHLIVRQFRLLVQAKDICSDPQSANLLSHVLSVSPGVARKLREQARHFTAEQLEAVYHQLLKTDISVKTGHIQPDIALDLLVAGVAGTP
jgi:DNA polymerase-3 subunit delta